MNTILKTEKRGQRLYVTLNIDGIKTIIFRFYCPYNCNSTFLKALTKAINNKNFDFNCPTTNLYQELADKIMTYMYHETYVDLVITGVYDKAQFDSLGIRVTDFGKALYAIYSQSGAFEAIPAEYGFTKALALEKMNKWAQTVNGTLNGLDVRYNAVSEDNGEVFSLIESIDTIEELVKYKFLYNDELNFLIERGLIRKSTISGASSESIKSMTTFLLS